MHLVTLGPFTLSLSHLCSHLGCVREASMFNIHKNVTKGLFSSSWL